MITVSMLVFCVFSPKQVLRMNRLYQAGALYEAPQLLEHKTPAESASSAGCVKQFILQ